MFDVLSEVMMIYSIWYYVFSLYQHAGPFSGFKLTKSIDLAGGNLRYGEVFINTLYKVEVKYLF